MCFGKKVKKTPNTDYCLETFKKAIETIEDEKLKQEVLDAHDYLFEAFSTGKQPSGGDICPTKVKVDP